MLKMFRNGARIAAPIIIIIQLLTIIKGYKNPLPEAADILSQHGNKVSILTGFSYSQLHDSETYLLIDPEDFSSYSVVIYKEKGELKVFDKTDGLLNYLFGYVFLMILFWWSWFWPAKHNNSLKKDAQ
ncbi:MAG: hypothetical protein OEY52_14910 [Gammaproteobacteria bacterium]|nr:hypothetical protein [Gammaproteobacteria bacterium]